MSVDLPTGWDGQIYRRAQAFSDSTAFDGREQPALHAGNFALPSERGDFGSGAVEVMGRRGVLVCLLEYDAESATSALFSQDYMPTSVRADDFQTHTLQRPQAGQGGQQVFFHQGDRAFCLYVVIGSHSLRGLLTPVVNEVLTTIQIQ